MLKGLVAVLLFLPAAQATLVISVSKLTNTSAGVTISGATANDCTVEVSLSPTYAPVIPDVDGTEYSGANTCSGRPDTATGAGDGTQILVQLGHKVSNRALWAATRYYLRVKSNGGADVATTSFLTETIGIGQTIPWPAPVDRRRRFNRGFGPTITEALAKTTQGDPVTGAQLWPMTGMNDITNRQGPFAFAFWSDGTGWTNPSHALDITSSGAQTSNTNPLTLYIGPESDPNNYLYARASWDDLGIIVYACGDDGSATNRTFTLTMSNNFSTGHMGTPITISTATQCASGPAGALPQVQSASLDANKPWPSSFPSVPFSGWGSNVLIGWDDRPTTVGGSVASGVFTASGLDQFHHFSPLLELGNKISLPGCSAGSGLCDVSALGGAGRVTVSGSPTNGGATATALRAGIQIAKTTAVGHLWVSVQYKTAFAFILNTTGGALATQCNTNAGTITTYDGHVGYLCVATGGVSGLAFMYFVSADGTSRMVWAGGRPPDSYFSGLGWLPGDIPHTNSNLFSSSQILPDPADPRGWYLYLTGGSPQELYRLHYYGDVHVVDTGYAWDLEGGSAFTPVTYPSDFIDWFAVNPSTNTIASQLGNFSYYPLSLFGSGFIFYGASGHSLYFENILGGQDHPGWVAVADMSTGTMILKDVFSSYDGQGISGKTNYGVIHNINPRMYPPDTVVVSLNDSNKGGGDPTHPYNGSFQMPIVAVDRGSVGSPSWSSNTALPAASDGSYLSTCPSNSWGFSGTNCVHLKVAKNGFCNIGPNAAETKDCPTSPSIAGWTASSFSQPFPAREGNAFADPSPGAFCNPYYDCESFKIISPLTLEGDGFSSVWIGRDAGYDYCTIRGFASADQPPQYVHNNGWIAVASPNQGTGCGAGTLVVQGQTQAGISATYVPHNMIGHTDIVPGAVAGHVGFVSASSGKDAATVAELFDLSTVNNFVTPTWHGSPTSIGGGVQAYTNSPGGVPWMVDANAMNGNGGTPPEVNWTTEGPSSIITGTSCADVYLISVTGSTDYKHIPLRAVAGSWPLEEVSSPTVDLCSGSVPGFTWASALANGEAMHGTISGGGTSQAGQVFVKVPNSSGNFGQNSCVISQHWANTPCVVGGNFVGGGFYRQRDYLQNDFTSVRSRWVTFGMEPLLEQYSYTGIIPLDATLSWTAWSYMAGWGMTPWLLKMPPYVDDSGTVNRTDTIATTVAATAKSGSTHARVRFGRNTSFYCWGSESTAADGTLAWAGRRESCVTDADGTAPFKFSSESQTLKACSPTCSITVPLIPQVLYYAQTEYLNSGGTVLGTDPVMFLSAGGVTTPACSTMTITPSTLSLGSSGGSGTLAVTADISCSWTASSNVGWITASGAGSGSGTITYTVAANTGGSSRAGGILADTYTVSVTEAGASCTFSLIPTGHNFPVGGAAQTVSIVASDSSCAWTAASGAWATVSATSGTGSVAINVTAAANGGGSRSDTLTIAGQPFAASQDGTGVPPFSGMTGAKAVGTVIR